MVTTTLIQLLQIVSATAAVLVASALYLWSRMKQRRTKLFPGCTGWPFIGEALSFSEPCPSYALGSFMEQRIARFGKVFSAKLLGNRVIVSADPELNRLVLNNKELFESYLPRHVRLLVGESDFHSGAANKLLRSSFANFFNPSGLQSFLPIANDIADRLLGSWESGSVVSVVPVATQFTFTFLDKVVLGMEPGPQSRKLQESYGRMADGLFALPLNLPGTKLNKALKAKKLVYRFLEQLMEERRGCNANGNNLLDYTINQSTFSSNQQMLDFVHSSFFGSDSVPSGLSLAVYFLHHCPKAVEELREEHLSFGITNTKDGSSELTWEGYKKLDFTQCVINEALRLGNLGRYLTRKASTNVQFKGYEIPQGCQVFTHICAMHLDPSVYGDPEVFNPWRWMSMSGTNKTGNLWAFGGRTRYCPGAELARLEISVFLHHLILRYNWKPQESDKPIGFPVRFLRGLPVRVDKVPSTI